jgi:hypothetical protein
MPSTSSPHRATIAREIAKRPPRSVPDVSGNGTGKPLKISEYFGINTFGVRQMRE